MSGYCQLTHADDLLHVRPQVREARFRQTSESTNSRVVTWSVIQLAILLGMCSCAIHGWSPDAQGHCLTTGNSSGSQMFIDFFQCRCRVLADVPLEELLPSQEACVMQLANARRCNAASVVACFSCWIFEFRSYLLLLSILKSLQGRAR
jgi:hypothetical protein